MKAAFSVFDYLRRLALATAALVRSCSRVRLGSGSLPFQKL
jgi:hypothetical protein